ncbi:uncharacterized protein LOC134841298 [Symsagittifera roscoffensis]|uniref:uncharacterized protein LOC134841298 n=1 Tax=Symsagittifera roscoffensis TaxID=84072 RepID=UPI00307C7983
MSSSKRSYADVAQRNRSPFGGRYNTVEKQEPWVQFDNFKATNGDIIYIGDFCRIDPCRECKKSHVGFVQSIQKCTEMSSKVHFQLVGKSRCCVPEDPFSIFVSHVVVRKIGGLRSDSNRVLIEGDIAWCYIPTINRFVYGEVKKFLEDDTKTKLKLVAVPEREQPSAIWNIRGVLHCENNTITVTKSLCAFAFRCTPCQVDDSCEIFFFESGIHQGIVKSVESKRYTVKLFHCSHVPQLSSKLYTAIQDGLKKGEKNVSNIIVRKIKSQNESDGSNDSTPQLLDNDVEMVDLTGYPSKKETYITEERNNPLIGKFCWIEDSYFADKSCLFEEHCGYIFTLLRDTDEVLVGVELIEPCMSCASATDGSFKGKLYLDGAKVKSCLFIPEVYLKLVDFAEVDGRSLQHSDVCQVFIPQTQAIELAYFIDAKDNGRLKMNFLNSEVFSRISEEKSNFLEIIPKKASQCLCIEIHQKLARFVFRCEPVHDSSQIEVYVPNHSIFNGFVMKKDDGSCSVVFADGNIKEACLGVDSRHFHSEGDSQYRIKNLFLRRTATSQVKDSNCEENRKQADKFDFEDHETEPSPKYESLKLSSETTTFNSRTPEFPRALPPNPETTTLNSRTPEFPRALPPNPESNSSVPSPSYESLKPHGIHLKQGEFCYIEEGYMTLFCEKKNHYGTVVAIISTKKGGATACVKLIGRCHCKTIGDGTYDGKLWLEKPLRERCLFVPVAKVQVIEFHKHSSGALFEVPKIQDVCDVFIPSLKRKFPAIVTNILEPESFVEVQMMDEMIRFTPNYEQNVDGLQKCILRNGFVYYQLRESFVRSLFSPSEVRVGTICRLFAPGQGVFQCLVDSLHENYRAQVTLLEGDIDRNEIKGLDDSFFQKIGGKSFIVSRNFLLFLADTDNDFGPGFVVVAKSESGDESFEPTTLSRDNTPRAARQYAVQQVHIGKKKGIQGHHNSCYMDSLFYSLFLFSDALDSICKIDLCKNVDIRNSSAFEMQNNLLTLIVNPLRGENCFVPAGNVMRLRKQLETFLPGVSKEEKDAEELLAVLFSKNFVGGDGHPPLLHLRNVMLEEDQDLFVYQVFVEPENEEAYAKMQKSIPCVQNILAQSFVLQGQFFRQNPTCFLIQLPRFGKEKVFPGIFLPIEIDISNISLSSPQKCSICSVAAAKLRCKSCSLSRSERVMGARENFSIIQYCEQCSDVIHKSRKNHVKDEIPTGEQSLNGFKYILDSVICIKTSHYVSFARTKLNSPDGKMTWLFFDSMADRVENRRFMDRNVPEVRECPTIEGHLKHLSGFKSETERLDYVERHALQDEMLKRLVQDAYIGVYRHKQDTMETEV